MAEEQFLGDPLGYGWMPHKPSTWSHRFATLKEPLVMKHYAGRWEHGEPVMRNVPLPAGARVKIVMVSRFGDIGITEDLSADHGYGARVSLSHLRDFSKEP